MPEEIHVLFGLSVRPAKIWRISVRSRGLSAKDVEQIARTLTRAMILAVVFFIFFFRLHIRLIRFTHPNTGLTVPADIGVIRIFTI
jgi:hypothetical protein